MFRRILTTVCTVLALAAGTAAQAADANQASAAELEAVKGIGPVLSGKILAARQQGSFKGWPDLLERVSGLGAGNAARLSKNGLTVAGAGYTPDAGAPAGKPGRAAKAGKAEQPAKDGVPATAAKARS